MIGPKFLAVAARIGESLGLAHPLLRVDALMAAARRRARLDDFGDLDFVAPLEKLLTSALSEARLTAIGRVVLGHDIVHNLENRLQLADQRRRHPAIAEQTIPQPLFIVSLPRTGTTLLHNLLAQDPANRVPLTSETRYPVPPQGDDDAIRRTDAELRWLERLAPGFAAIHPVGAYLPQECLVLMAHGFESYQYQTMFDLPSYVGWLKGHELEYGYRVHQQFLQHLNWRRPGRWVLKAPAHMASMDALLSRYPDARLVQLHRDPGEVLASDASLTAALFSAFAAAPEPDAVGRETLERLASWLDQLTQARDRLPQSRICDLYYRDLVADPLATVAKLYQHFGIEFTPAARGNMAEFLAHNPKDKHGGHRYRLRDFGIEQAGDDKRIAAYRARFGI